MGRANRDAATMTGSYEKTVKKSAVLARRLVSWFFFVPPFYNTQKSNFVSVRHHESTNSHAARFHAYLAPVRREREREGGREGHGDFNC